ncbi:YrdB family protein [Micromonospora sp. WMMD812]|uniref:YrdB family protein n=1 Tax=Micromonospora sp. WMMD812 TaxID=3015152 RepID=UPI00248C6FEF|nr:YrdB family protein [Micromonospora sp. WMMD812]WBB66247.1 YrdB family protein [Micromonospora sp. WMMD812]
MIRGFGLLLVFLLELAVLVIGARWGWAMDAGVPIRLLAAVAVPLLLAALWGVLGSPKARVPLPAPAKHAFQAAWFVLGGGMLALLGRPLLGVALVAVWAVTVTLLRLGGRPA